MSRGRFNPMAFLQPLGREMMLPIAVLPVDGLLLRVGQPDMLNIAFVSAAGDAIFAHLGLLFAVGVATGFARDGNGAAAMAGVVCYLVVGNCAQLFFAVPPDAVPAGLEDKISATLTAAWKAAAIDKLQVPIGIIAGLVGGGFYNRFATVKLPDYLAFFGGRRLVPILAGIAGLVIGGLLGPSYGAISAGVDGLSRGVVAAGGWGLFAFGVLNRLLIVTGLHHILNNVAYFVVGDYHGKTGDLTRFFAGDPTAGGFMSGFFPVMMFGLPAACLAMYRTALPERRKAVGGMLLSLALTSFLTGVTEPIEFSFMFLAPVLYAIHALLTGAAEALMNALGVRMGYGFSAGLFDYLLNFGKATKPLLLLPVGLLYARAVLWPVSLGDRAVRPEDARTRAAGGNGDVDARPRDRRREGRRVRGRAGRREQPARHRCLYDAAAADRRRRPGNRRAAPEGAGGAWRAAPIADGGAGDRRRYRRRPRDGHARGARRRSGATGRARCRTGGTGGATGRAARGPRRTGQRRGRLRACGALSRARRRSLAGERGGTGRRRADDRLAGTGRGAHSGGRDLIPRRAIG